MWFNTREQEQPGFASQRLGARWRHTPLAGDTLSPSAAVTSVLGDVPDPGQRLVATLLDDLQVAHLERKISQEIKSLTTAKWQLEKTDFFGQK